MATAISPNQSAILTALRTFLLAALPPGMPVVRVQIDVHGPNAVDNAAAITTLFFDEQGVNLFTSAAITPLFCEDPRQVPFINAEQAYEDRVVITAHLQANQQFALPEQFAAALGV